MTVELSRRFLVEVLKHIISKLANDIRITSRPFEAIIRKNTKGEL